MFQEHALLVAEGQLSVYRVGHQLANEISIRPSMVELHFGEGMGVEIIDVTVEVSRCNSTCGVRLSCPRRSCQQDIRVTAVDQPLHFDLWIEEIATETQD